MRALATKPTRSLDDDGPLRSGHSGPSLVAARDFEGPDDARPGTDALGLEHAAEAVFWSTPDARLVSANHGMAWLFGYETPEEFLANVDRMDELFTEWTGSRDLFETIAAQGVVSDFATELRRRDGTTFWAAANATAVRDRLGNLIGFHGLFVDVTERKLAEEALARERRFVEMLSAVAVAANEAAVPEAAIQVALDRVCAITGWPVGHAWATVGDPPVLVSMGCWHLADSERFDSFRARTEESRLESGVGLPGMVLANTAAAWCVDLEGPHWFPTTELALKLGLRTAYAFPVLTGKEVAAVIEFFSPGVDPPADLTPEMMEQVGTQLGRVVERSRGEQALLATQRQLEEAQALSAMGSFDWEVHADVLKVSEEMCRILGFDPGAPPMTLGPLLGRVVLEDQPRVWDGIQTAVRKRGPFDFEARVERPDGSIRTLHCQGKVTGDEWGGKHLLGTCQDVTERVRTQAALAEAEAKYRTLVERLPAITYVAPFGDLPWKFISPQVESILGFTTDEWLARGSALWESVVHPDDLERVLAEEAECERTRGQLLSEYRMLTRDGQVRWFRDEATVQEVDGELLLQGVLYDITDRMEAERAQEESLSLLRATLESTADGILVVDEDRRIVDYNRRFQEMWGIPDEVLAARDGALVRTFVLDQLEDPDGFLASVEERWSEPTSSGTDIVRFLDGRVFERSSQPQRIKGVDVGRVWSFRDVTDQLRAAEQLREQRDLYRLLLEGQSNLGDGVLIEEGERIVYVNEAFCTMIGAQREELTGSRFTDLLADEERERIAGRVRGRTGAFVDRYQTVMVHRSGRRIEVERAVTSLDTMSGRRLVINRDITVRKELERELVESERLARSTLDALSAHVAIVADDGTIIAVNEAWRTFAKQYARAPHDLAEGANYLAVCDAAADAGSEEARSFARGLRNVMSGHRSEHVQEYAAPSPNEQRWFVARITPFSEEFPGRVVVAHEDITERKRAELGLLLSLEEVQRSDDARSVLLQHLVQSEEQQRQRIASDIHDDSLQVITAVGMRLQSLERSLSEDSQQASLGKLARTVEEAIARLRTLMFNLRPPALDRDGLQAALEISLETMRRETGMEYTVESNLRREPPAGTRIVLFRVAQEALSNVRKHSGAGRVTVVLDDQAGTFYVRIRDDGIGFEEQERDARRSKHFGLSIMRERAEMAGGWLKLATAPGRGTTVEFAVPGGREDDPGAGSDEEPG